MKIYTKKGDKGETTLFTGQKIPKNDITIETLGTVDECNSAIGAAISFMPSDTKYHVLRNQLEIIQHALFDLGAAVATPRTRAADSAIERTRFDKEEVDIIEKWIDEMDNGLPKLTTFILPGGHPAGAMLHLARSICRRAERIVVPLHLRADVSDKVMMYLNRLSDYLFVASRYLNYLANSSETKWKPHCLLRTQDEDDHDPSMIGHDHDKSKIE